MVDVVRGVSSRLLCWCVGAFAALLIPRLSSASMDLIQATAPRLSAVEIAEIHATWTSAGDQKPPLTAEGFCRFLAASVFGESATERFPDIVAYYPKGAKPVLCLLQDGKKTDVLADEPVLYVLIISEGVAATVITDTLSGALISGSLTTGSGARTDVIGRFKGTVSRELPCSSTPCSGFSVRLSGLYFKPEKSSLEFVFQIFSGIASQLGLVKDVSGANALGVDRKVPLAKEDEPTVMKPIGAGESSNLLYAGVASFTLAPETLYRVTVRHPFTDAWGPSYYEFYNRSNAWLALGVGGGYTRLGKHYFKMAGKSGFYVNLHIQPPFAIPGPLGVISLIPWLGRDWLNAPTTKFAKVTEGIVIGFGKDDLGFGGIPQSPVIAYRWSVPALGKDVGRIGIIGGGRPSIHYLDDAGHAHSPWRWFFGLDFRLMNLWSE